MVAGCLLGWETSVVALDKLRVTVATAKAATVDWGPWPAGGTLRTPSTSQGVSLLPLPPGDPLTAAPDLGKGVWGDHQPHSKTNLQPEVFIAKVQKRHSRDVQQ